MDNNIVYIIEDDENIRDLLVYNLEGAGFTVSAFETGELGLSAAKNNLPDVLLLDWMLPGIDGYEICRRIRENSDTKNIFIIMLTARGEEGDKILGLEIGADDYIVKPFSTREVVARVRAAVRRIERNQEENKADVLKIGDIKIVLDKREAYKNDIMIELKAKEFDLLYYIMKNAGRVLTREQLLDAVWGYNYIGETRTVDVHISQLRMKIEEKHKTPVYINTIRSIGYKFNQMKKEV